MFFFVVQGQKQTEERGTTECLESEYVLERESSCARELPSVALSFNRINYSNRERVIAIFMYYVCPKNIEILPM